MMKHDQDDAMRVLYEASLQGSIEKLNSLIQRDQLVLDKISLTTLSETPLHISALRGHLEFTIALLSHKPKLASELDSLRRLPLHLAAAEGHTEVVKALLSFGAATNSCKARDEDGRTPLHLAATRGRVDVMQELLRLCPESILEKVDGYSVLHLCVQYNHLEALMFLVERVSSKSYCHEFILNEIDLHGCTILHQALILKQVKTVEYLVSKAAIREKANVSIVLSPALDLKSLKIQEILAEAGIFRPQQSNSNNSAPAPAPAPTAADDEHIQGAETTNRMRKFLKWLTSKRQKKQHEGDWIKETSGSLMVVATVMASISFQATINPPGGVWEEDNTTKSLGCSNATICSAGTAVLAYNNNTSYYDIFVFCNTVSFVTSLSVVLMLISGLPTRNKFFMWLLTLTIMASVTFMTTSYLSSVLMMSAKTDDVINLFAVVVYVWFGLLGVTLLFLVGRFLYWLLNKAIGRTACLRISCLRHVSTAN